MRYIFLVFLFLLVCNLPTTPSAPPLPDSVLASEFGMAQVKVESKYGLDARRVERHDFKWKPVDGPMWCGDVWANGCFSPGSLVRRPSITYNVRTPSVVRHEAGHAILYALGDSRWKCFEHTC